MLGLDLAVGVARPWFWPMMSNVVGHPTHPASCCSPHAQLEPRKTARVTPTLEGEA